MLEVRIIKRMTLKVGKHYLSFQIFFIILNEFTTNDGVSDYSLNCVDKGTM